MGAKIENRSTLAPVEIKTSTVAQLWQRDRTKLDKFSINVQLYSQNHAQNCIIGPPCGAIKGNISALTKKF